jgi:hypothetical protein
LGFGATVVVWVDGSIKLKNNGDDIRLYLEPKMPLISADDPLPPRGDMHVISISLINFYYFVRALIGYRFV